MFPIRSLQLIVSPGLDIVGPQYMPVMSKDFSKYKWNMITCAQHHTIGLTTEGKVMAIGRREYGRLGLGENCEDAKELVEVSTLTDKKTICIGAASSSSFAVTEDGNHFSTVC